MFKFDSRLLFFILVVGLLTVVMSCSQTDDITAPKSLTTVWLRAERLPTPVDGMTYELWASKKAKADITDESDVASLGQFSYITSDALVAFLEPTPDTLGNPIVRADSNQFVLNGDLFDYSYLFVSVEDLDVPATMPGPVMLMQTISGATDTLKLYFPLHDSLFESIVRCNFETPTDENRGSDGYGLWFSSYQSIRRRIVDTLDADISWVDTTLDTLQDKDGNIINLATLYKAYPDSVWVTFDTTQLDFGRDTLALSIDKFMHAGAKQHVITKVDSVWPRTIKNYTRNYDTVIRFVDLDIFSQDLYLLPDLSPFGWKYKGWIVSDGLDDLLPTKFTPPAWDYKDNELLIPGYAGRMMTTGTFTDITSADDDNPFTLEVIWEVDSTVYDTTVINADSIVIDTSSFIDSVLKRPNLPGEDFLDGAALALATNNVYTSRVNLLSSSSGTIFVSIEPDNMPTDTTNFPLLVLGRKLPQSGSDWGLYFFDGAWTLQNWSGYAAGTNGFPLVTARIRRQ